MNQVAPALCILTLSAFNLPIVTLLCCLPFVDRLSQAVKEKPSDAGAPEVTSFSRMAGLFGIVILTALFWATGNVLLVKALTGSAGDIPSVLDDVGRYILVSSTLFIPYAFNQLKSAISFAYTLAGAAAVAKPIHQAGGAGGILGASNVVQPQVLGVTVVNLSALVDDATLSTVLEAIKIQITRDFTPEWGIAANLSSTRASLTTGKIQVDAATDAMIYLADSTLDPRSGTTGLAGYHAENRGAVPYGFVYLDVCKTWSEPWSCTLSHEILEMLADPTAAMTVAGPDSRVNSPNPPTVTYHLEVCDPTNGDSYLINGIAVSNFVTKRYFGLLGSSPATNQQRLTLNPFGVRPGGYVQFDDATGVNEVDGSRVDPARVAGQRLLGPYRRNARRAARLESSAAGESRRQGSGETAASR